MFRQTRMSIQLCILGSGSAGNASVVRTPFGKLLIDAGLGPRTVSMRLDGTGVGVAEIAAICLTHLDRDHFNLNWVTPLLRRQVPLYCHASRVVDLRRIAAEPCLDPLIRSFHVQPFSPLPGVTLWPIALDHDADGSHGFVVECCGERLGYATDLGSVPGRLIDAFHAVDLLAIESNYDPAMQRTSGRPWFLQQRITGGRGHLSNEQAFDAVREILNRCEIKGAQLPHHVALLHRSRQCNCPNLVRSLFNRDPRIAPRLTLAEQQTRTPWLARQAQPQQQLQFAWT